jgi:hypothetical protein
VALDEHAGRLDTGGPIDADLPDELGRAAITLVENGRGRQAVTMLQRLGSYAGGEPRQHRADPGRRVCCRYRLRACSRF